MTTLYRGSNAPVFINNNFVKRAQSFEIIITNNEETVIELGEETPVGSISRAIDYTASLMANEVGQGILSALGITNWKSYGASPSERSIATLSHGISGAIVSSITLEASVRNPSKISVEFIGKGATTNATPTPSVDLSLPGAVMYPGCNVSVGTLVQGFTLSAKNNIKLIYELNSLNPVGWIIEGQEVRLEVECLYPGTCPQYLTETSAQDITVTIRNLSIVIKKCITTGEPKTGSVRGWVSGRYIYRSLDSNFIVS